MPGLSWPASTLAFVRRRLVIAVVGVLVVVTAAAIAFRAIERLRFTPITIVSSGDAVAPAHVCVPARAVRVADALFLPGNDALLLYVEVEALSLWSVAVRFWPELALLAALPLAALVALASRWRRPTTDDPHCRRCDYALVGSTGERCPECGLQLAPRDRVGPRSRRWLRIACVLVPLVLLAAYVPARHKLPRRGAATSWMQWPSTFAYDWLFRHGHGPFVTQHRVFHQRLVWLDPVAGRSRDVALRGGDRSFPMAAWDQSSDGARMALLRGPEVVVMDLRTLREEQRLRGRAVGDPDAPTNEYAHAAFSADGERVCGVRMDGLIDWWRIDGTVLPSFERPELFSIKNADVWPVALQIRKGAALVAVGSSGSGRPPAARLERMTPDLGSTLGEPLTLSNGVRRVQLAPDGERWFALEVGATFGTTLLTGTTHDAPVTRTPLPADHGTALAIAPDGRALFVGGFSTVKGALSGSGALLDLPSMKQAVEFGAPEIAPMHARFSPDGRRVVICGIVRVGAARQAPVVAVYDLPSRSAEAP